VVRLVNDLGYSWMAIRKLFAVLQSPFEEMTQRGNGYVLLRAGPLFPSFACDGLLTVTYESSIDERNRVSFAGRGDFHCGLQGGIVFVMRPVRKTPCRPGRCSQAGEAAIWNRRDADGGTLRIALPAT
jgi:hypothetical protein